MSKIESITLLCLFLAFLFAPAGAYVSGVGGGGEALENKALKEFPEVSVDAIADATFGEEFSEYVWDHLPYRGTLLRWDHLVDYHLFGDTPVPGQIVLGDNGFVFVQERIHGKRSGAKPGLQRTLVAIKRLEDAATEAGIPLVIAISPNKATLYPEYLPPGFRTWHAAHVQPVVRGLERYADYPGSTLINGWRALRAEKERLAAPGAQIQHERMRYVFRPHDRHWSLETGRLQAAEIVRAIEGVEWDSRYGAVLAGEPVEGVSELSEVYMKLGPLEPYDRLVDNPRVSLTLEELEHDIDVFSSEARGDLVPDERTLVVIRDSFLNSGLDAPANRQGGGMWSIAPFFRKTVFVHMLTATKEPENATNSIQQGDLLVIQVVQGNLGNLVGHNRVLRQHIAAMGEAKRARQTPEKPPQTP